MSYKVKSLVYFTCFLASSFAYYSLGSENEFENRNDNKEIAELSMERVTFDKDTNIK